MRQDETVESLGTFPKKKASQKMAWLLTDVSTDAFPWRIKRLLPEVKFAAKQIMADLILDGSCFSCDGFNRFFTSVYWGLILHVPMLCSESKTSYLLRRKKIRQISKEQLLRWVVGYLFEQHVNPTRIILCLEVV